MMKHRRKFGFTLIELLVCFSILVLVLGILIPAISAVRGEAQGTASSSSIQKIDKTIYRVLGSTRWKRNVLEESLKEFRDMYPDLVIVNMTPQPEDYYGEVYYLIVVEER